MIKACIKNNKLLFASLGLTAALFLSLFIPLHLPGNPANYRTEGTDIVFRYDLFGSGSLVRTVEKGGAALYAKANLPEPASGVYEIQFTTDSDEPKKHMDSGEFYTGGLAQKYAYYMTVELAGTEKGAPDCCGPEPAYNETVPLVRVVRWEPATFTPQAYFTTRHYVTLLVLPVLLLANIALLIRCVYAWAKKKGPMPTSARDA